MMREYQNQGKKTNTDVSIPALKNPVRGFGLKPLDTSPSALPEAQVIDKPPGHHISKIPLRRPEQSISQPQDCDEQHNSIVQQLFRRMEAERISRSYVQPGEMSTPEVQQSQTQPLVDWITPVVQRQQASQQQQQLNTDAVQLKCSQCEEKEKRHHADEETQLTGNDLDEQVQLKANEDNGAKSIQQLAAQGFSGSPTTLPHLNQIQQSFGVELSHVQAYMGSDAAKACQQMGADAYASGNQIAFKEAPSVELAAHEAAHVVQQASGKVQLSGGVGKVGDKYEQQADDVAARVGLGESAPGLLREHIGNANQENVQAKTSEVPDNENVQNQEKNQPHLLKEGENLYAIDYTVRPPQGDPNSHCFDLLEIIEMLAKELKKRYDDMLDDQHWLYLAKTTNNEHRLPKQWGTWDGHKYKYNQVQKELRKVLNEFIKNKDCDDDNDPDGYGAREGYDLAWEYVDLRSPSEPRPKNQGEAPPWAISWIEELGGTIKDGAIIVGQGASEAALTILSLIAGILMMPLRKHAY